MCARITRLAVEADVLAALDNTSFGHWPRDEREMLEVVNIIIHQLNAGVGLDRAAEQSLRFLSRIG